MTRLGRRGSRSSSALVRRRGPRDARFAGGFLRRNTHAVAFDDHVCTDRHGLGLTEYAPRAVVHPNVHVESGFAARAALDLIARDSAANCTKNRHRSLSIAAADLVPDNAAQYTAGHGAEASSLTLDLHCANGLDCPARSARHGVSHWTRRVPVAFWRSVRRTQVRTVDARWHRNYRRCDRRCLQLFCLRGRLHRFHDQRASETRGDQAQQAATDPDRARQLGETAQRADVKRFSR